MMRARTIKHTLGYTLAALAATAALVVAFCPRPALYGDVPFSTAVEDRHGRLLRLALAADDRYRLRVPLAQIAPSAIAATLAYEDRYFRLHPGVNPVALLRAAWSTYVTAERPVGGSTISMQLARLRFALDTRTLCGKLVQMARAIQLERHYSKDEILEAYLNLAPYGGNIEGIGTAALVYFDKPAAALSPEEALALAVIPQNPAKRNPRTREGYDRMQAARARLFEVWKRRRDVDAESEARFALPLSVRTSRELPFFAPHFSQALLEDRRGPGGLLTTTLDLSVQQSVERQVAFHVERHAPLGIDNAAALLVDHRSMEIRAAVGSADFFDERIAGQVDGTRARRSPGSTLKPFVYGLAIDAGLIHPMSLLKDAPKRFAEYTPENFDRGFMGPVSAQDALIYSRNVPAIEMLARVGHDNFHRLLVDAGVEGLRPADHYGLAMILGGNELTMEELVRLYAMLANGGRLQRLEAVRGDAPRDGGSDRWLLSPEASFLVLDMLRNNPRPDSLPIVDTRVDAGISIPWKTGTSYAYRDAWAVGIVGPYVLAVWVGNFDGSGNPAFVGRQAAAPLFFSIADELSARLPVRSHRTGPPPHLNLRRIATCAGTGDLPGRHCPQTVDSWFIPGVSPIKVSDVHRAVRVDRQTGERACSYDPQTTREEVFEFWPSDIQRVFRNAGIAIRRPPPWAAGCALRLRATTGTAPQITSPSSRLTYHVRLGSVDDERLPLTATTDAGVRSLYWFVGDRFIARVDRDEPLLWTPEVGRHDVVAVDDLGRSASTTLTVRLAPVPAAKPAHMD